MKTIPGEFYSAMNLIGSHDSIRILTKLGEAPPEEGLGGEGKGGAGWIGMPENPGVKRLKLITLMHFLSRCPVYTMATRLDLRVIPIPTIEEPILGAGRMRIF